jgi:hypothetical protein
MARMMAMGVGYDASVSFSTSLFTLGDDSAERTMSRPAIIPLGCWPRRMCAELAAAYCGEPSVDAFISRLGKE